MTPTPDELAMIEAIRANPEDDAVRVAFADMLDENAGEVPCPLREMLGYCGGPAPGKKGRKPCSECNDTGAASDGRKERAELVRLQCTKRADRPAHNHTGCENREQCQLCERMSRISAAKKYLISTLPVIVRESQYPLKDTYEIARGFVHTVRGPLAAFWEDRECERCDGTGWDSRPDMWTPAPRCRLCNAGRVSGPTAAFAELVKREPVQVVEVVNLQPVRVEVGRGESWLWYGDRHYDQVFDTYPEGIVPQELIRRMPGSTAEDTSLEYDTEADARAALSDAMISAALGRAGAV